MKIAAIATSHIPSDTANSIQAMKVCQALQQLGHTVTLLTPRLEQASPAQTEWMRQYGLTTPFDVVHLPVRNRRLFTWVAVQHTRRLSPNIIYTWVPQSAAFAARCGLPVVLELHDLPTGTFGPLWLRLFLASGTRKRLLVITHALRNALEHDLRLDLDKQDVVIAPNGVDLDRYNDLPDPGTARKQAGLPDKPIVMCSGHLYAGRGADLFLALAHRHPQAHFAWVGGRAEDVNTWKLRAGELHLQNISFTGFLPNKHLPTTLAAADVLLMPYGRVIGISTGVGRSAEVASPMKMFEYMATGRAILSSDLPVIREVLDESMAIFAPPEAVEDWSHVLADLLANNKKRQTLGASARGAVEKYTWLERQRKAVAGLT